MTTCQPRAAHLRIVTLPTFEPISLAEARAQVRCNVEISDSDQSGGAQAGPSPQPLSTDDALLLAYISAARAYAEQWTGLALTDAVYELRLDRFDARVEFPIAPVGQVVGVQYLNAAGQWQTLDPYTCELDDHPSQPALLVAAGRTWPKTAQRAGAVRIRFRAPYAQGGGPQESVAVDESIKQALRLIIGHWYENREDVVLDATVAEIPKGATALLNMHRRAMGV